METNSVEVLLNWLKVKPRTRDWGAILAYGRSETNKVLLQEYITRFGTTDYLEPITEEVLDNQSPTQKDFVHNYQMDRPRLSFLGSNLQKSAAKLSMQVVGGSHLTFTKAQGSTLWSISRISQEDVLDGPSLKCDIDLMARKGSVNSAGQVELNIAEGTNYELTYVQTRHLRKVAGERFQQVFKSLPDYKTRFPLSDLKYQPGQLLKPENFVIRTHNKQGSGAKLLANEDAGEGAVLVFVAMEGEENGTVPIDNADLKYLLPDGHSATVLLSQKTMQKRVFSEGLRNVNEMAEFAYEDIVEEGNIYGVRGLKGGVKLPAVSAEGDGYKFDVPDAFIKFDSFRFEFWAPHVHGDEAFDYRLIMSAYAVRLPAELSYMGGAGVSGFIAIGLDFQYELEAVIDNNQVSFKVKKVWSEQLAVVETSYGNSTIVKILLEAVREALGVKIKSILRTAMDVFVESLPPINAFTLNSLLFRGDNAVSIKMVNQPLDLALFGHVGPLQTAFTIKELEPTVGHSQTLQFTTEPPRNDLTWKVENIMGETVPVGGISSSTGLYTAPTATQLQGNFVRARVTATAGAYTSSALVTVMRRNITINPMIQVATAGDPLALDVSAGTVDGGALTWSIENPASGATIKPNPADDGDHSYVPGPPQEKTPPNVDTIVVHNPRSNVTETTKVMVCHRPVLLTVVIVQKPGLPDNQIQLAIMGEDGPINPGDWNEKWTVLLGGGSAQINADTGLLTVNTTGPDRYVVVTVLAPAERPNRPDDDGYIILPLPLFSVPETIRMLCADDQSIIGH
ncbi:hypothetical protein H7698_16375 [Pseudomonas sp. p50]|uniref:hypothetical protein n=1 Tax=Pseudomonas sp. p50(2008) TaxID=2816832 RepID=UPI00188CB598|nr:hypothetical protein [Pseudomonas sp. p50(2008)]MBF4557654.1 hypothetical protein [Pseudomonas sp. p50(2008)]